MIRVGKLLLLILITVAWSIGAEAENGGNNAAEPVIASPAVDGATRPVGRLLGDSVTSYLAKKGWIVPKETKDDGLVTINFKDQDINNIIKFISDQTGKAILKSDEVQGKFTILCPTRVTKQKALDLILTQFEMKGITWIESGDLIQIIPLKSAPLKVLEIETGAEIPQDSRIRTLRIPLKYADPAKIQETVKPLLPETSSIIADPRTKTLLITATGIDLGRMQKIIGTLDVPDHEGAVGNRIFCLKYAKAVDLAKILSEMIAHYEASRPSTGEKDKAAGPSTKLFSDVASNTILAVGVSEALDMIANLISQLDTTTTGEFKTEIFKLKSADAKSVAQSVGQLLLVHKTSFAEPKVLPNEWTNSLIVSCMPDDMESIRNLIKEMDTEKTQDRDTRIYKIQHGDAKTISDVFQSLFMERNYRNRYYRYGSQTRDDSILFMADERLNALIVNALDEEFPQIESLIKELDQSVEEGNEEPRFYRLKYTDAQQVAETINELYSSKSKSKTTWDRYDGGYFTESESLKVGGFAGRVKVLPETITNSVVVISSTSRAFESVEKLINMLDQEVPDSGSTRIIKMQNANAVEVAQALNDLFKRDDGDRRRNSFFDEIYGGSRDSSKDEISKLVGRVRIVAEQRTNSLLITASKQSLETIDRLVQDLDTQVPQVLIEVLIVEVLLSDLDELGIDWGGKLAVGTKGEAEFSRNERSVVRTLPDDSTVTDIVPHKFDRYSFLSSTDYNVILNYLSSKTLLNVMSRPNIITTNNRRARINNSIEVPIPDNISTTNTGTLSSFKYRDVGLILDVTPSVSIKTGLVVMDTRLTTGSILESNPIRVGEAEFNRFTKREIRTNIGVNTGQTVVLGGVISEDKSTVERKVPLLGSIPVVGRPFRNNRDLLTKSELITFITPYDIEKPEDMYKVTQQQQERIQAFELLRSESIKKQLDSVMSRKTPNDDGQKKKKRSDRSKSGGSEL